MKLEQSGITAVLLVGLSTGAWAQQAPVDVSRLPIDVDRIQRQLKASAEREDHDGLNLRYIIEVFGQAPRIRLFSPEDNLRTGPVPYGAPTHREIVNAITPKEFRAPAADFSAVLRWLNERGSRDRSQR